MYKFNKNCGSKTYKNDKKYYCVDGKSLYTYIVEYTQSTYQIIRDLMDIALLFTLDISNSG